MDAEVFCETTFHYICQVCDRRCDSLGIEVCVMLGGVLVLLSNKVCKNLLVEKHHPYNTL